jgi:hypothetical protein
MDVFYFLLSMLQIVQIWVNFDYLTEISSFSRASKAATS